RSWRGGPLTLARTKAVLFRRSCCASIHAGKNLRDHCADCRVAVLLGKLSQQYGRSDQIFRTAGLAKRPEHGGQNRDCWITHATLQAAANIPLQLSGRSVALVIRPSLRI